MQKNKLKQHYTFTIPDLCGNRVLRWKRSIYCYSQYFFPIFYSIWKATLLFIYFLLVKLFTANDSFSDFFCCSFVFSFCIMVTSNKWKTFNNVFMMRDGKHTKKTITSMHLNNSTCRAYWHRKMCVERELWCSVEPLEIHKKNASWMNTTDLLISVLHFLFRCKYIRTLFPSQ